MTAETRIFAHVTNEGSKRGLELRGSEVSLHFDARPQATFVLTFEGTEPGMTTSERFGEEWDSPVRVEVGVTVPLADGMTCDAFTANSTAPAEDYEQFVYYWEHTDITKMTATVTGVSEQRILLDLSVDSSEGQVVFQGSLPIRHLRLNAADASDKSAVEGRAKAFLARAVLPEWKDCGDFGHELYLELSKETT